MQATLLQASYSWYYTLENFLDELGNSPLMTPILVLLLIFFILKRSKKSYHSNWNSLVENFYFSPSDFYELLQVELENHEVDGITSAETSLHEDWFGSHKRLYLKVKWRNLNYHVCAAPFGNHYFFSWHLQNSQSLFSLLISKIPFIGGWLFRRFFPETMYKLDTASMFMTFAHSSVLKVVDQITKEGGVRALTEAERKPVLADIFKR